MRLDYGTLLSFKPLYLQGGFGIISPTLKQISELGFDLYHYYLSVLNLSINKYYEQVTSIDIDYFKNYTKDEKDVILKIKQSYDGLSDDEKSNISTAAILSYDKRIIDEVALSLSFFTDKKFEYSKDNNAFISVDNGEITATLDIRIYNEVVNFVLQRNAIDSTKQEEKPKFKNKLVEELYYRTLKAEEKRSKDKKKNVDLEIPNMISSVSARHNTLNIINIWDITIYQLYDQFQRLQNNCMFDIQSLSVAAWGDKESKFDPGIWYKNLYYQK
jgi:hypothetical protein